MERICRALLRDRHESEDAAQQTFLSAFRALRNGAEPRETEAWLGSIARNECLRRIRERMREPLPTLDHELEDGRADVHGLAVSNMNAAHLWQEIQVLPEQQRDAVVLREFAGLSYDELAVALGVSGSAVESLLFRARGTLRRRLQTAVASLNLAGAASGLASLVARVLAGGAAPIATKAAAVGVGAAVFGGSAIIGERALEHPAAARVTMAVNHRTPAPVRAAITKRSVAVLTAPHPRSLDSEGQRSSASATSDGGDRGEVVSHDGGHQSAGHGEEGSANDVGVAQTSVSITAASDEQSSGDGGDGESDSGSSGQD